MARIVRPWRTMPCFDFCWASGVKPIVPDIWVERKGQPASSDIGQVTSFLTPKQEQAGPVSIVADPSSISLTATSRSVTETRHLPDIASQEPDPRPRESRSRRMCCHASQSGDRQSGNSSSRSMVASGVTGAGVSGWEVPS